MLFASESERLLNLSVKWASSSSKQPIIHLLWSSHLNNLQGFPNAGSQQEEVIPSFSPLQSKENEFPGRGGMLDFRVLQRRWRALVCSFVSESAHIHSWAQLITREHYRGWCYRCCEVISICYIIYKVTAASEGSLYVLMCPGPGVMLGWEEDQGNKKEGSWQEYGSWPGCKMGFSADFPPLWVVPGAAASFKGGCVFSGLKLYMWIGTWIFPEGEQIQEHKWICVTSDSTGGMFSGVLEKRVSCAIWDPVTLDVSFLYS